MILLHSFIQHCLATRRDGETVKGKNKQESYEPGELPPQEAATCDRQAGEDPDFARSRDHARTRVTSHSALINLNLGERRARDQDAAPRPILSDSEVILANGCSCEELSSPMTGKSVDGHQPLAAHSSDVDALENTRLEGKTGFDQARREAVSWNDID